MGVSAAGRGEGVGGVEGMLGDAAWVGRLARGLVRDGEEAEDLAQDVWVAALGHPRESGRRGWLVAVARNLARDRWRRRERRRARQGRVARVDAVGEAGAAVERAEIHQRLVRMALELPEPYRGAVIEHYLEGKSARAIAQGAGRPVATVRTWLQRGLVLLRERLRREWGVDWRESCLGLAFPVKVLAGWSGAGVLLMSGKFKIALSGLGLLGLLLWAIAAGGGGGALRDRPGRPVAAPVAGDAVALLAEAEGERSALGRAAPEVPGAGGDASAGGEEGISGQVVDQTGAGIPGAWVAAWAGEAAATTDGSGRFVIPLAEPFRADRYYPLIAWAPGFDAESTQIRGEGPAAIVLRPARPAELRILDRATGSPIPGARARAVCEGSALINEGRPQAGRWQQFPFELPPADVDGRILLPSASALTYRIEAEGFEEGIVGSIAEYIHKTEVRLERRRSYRIRFLREDGAPVAGARVDFDPQDEPRRTDHAGWVEVPELARSSCRMVAVSTEGWGFVFAPSLGAEAWDFPAAGAEVVVPHRPRSGRLLVRGVEAAACEVSTSAVAWFYGDRLWPDPRRAPELLRWQPVAADGTFAVVDGWQGLGTTLHIRRRGELALLASEKLRGPGPYEVVLEVKAVQRATIRLLAEPAEALRGASLLLRGPGEPRQPLPLEDGAVHVPLTSGTWTARLQGGAFRQEVLVGRFLMPDAEAEIELDLGRLRPLRGRVTAGGRPLAACTLRFQQPAGYAPARRVWEEPHRDSVPQAGFVLSCRPELDGTWTLPWVPDLPLAVQILTEDPWLATAESQLFEIPPGVENHDIDVPCGLLRLSSAGPAPPQSQSVTVWRYALPEAGGDPIELDSYVNGAPLPDLAQGPIDLRISASTITWFHLDPRTFLLPPQVTIRPGETLSIELQLVTAGEVAVVWESATGRCTGDLELIPLATPSLAAPRPWTAHEYQNDLGGLPTAFTALPGTYQLLLRGPVQPLSPRTRRPTGQPWGRPGDTWTLPLEVLPGRKTLVTLRPDGQTLHLEAHTPN